MTLWKTKTERRERWGMGGYEWCEIEVQLRRNHAGKLVLSICGSAGDIWDRGDAEAHAKEYWVTFFEEMPEEMVAMGQRFNTCFCNDAEKAAEFVLATDGDMHGLDVHDEDGDRVYVTHSCGQIRDTLYDFFPEYIPYMKWHLNDMNPSDDGKRWEYTYLPLDVILWAHRFGA